MIKIIGHRGCKGEEPENTLLGIRSAFEKDVDGVEIDVHLSKDGKLVVIHDDTIDRTTNGSGMVSDYTVSELEKFDAGSGEKIPLLRDVLELVKKNNKKLLLEIKCDNAELKVAAALNDMGMIGSTIVKSFDHRHVKEIKSYDPLIQTACLFVGRPVNVLGMVRAAYADGISINYHYVDSEMISVLHQAGKKVLIWNVDDKALVEKYRSLGVDYIGTNVVGKILG